MVCMYRKGVTSFDVRGLEANEQTPKSMNQTEEPMSDSPARKHDHFQEI
jgi:hypothetical protein